MKLTMTARPNDDQEITCVVCMEPKCDHDVRAWDPHRGARVWFGIHKSCAKVSGFCKESSEDNDGTKTIGNAPQPESQPESDA